MNGLSRTVYSPVGEDAALHFFSFCVSVIVEIDNHESCGILLACVQSVGCTCGKHATVLVTCYHHFSFPVGSERVMIFFVAVGVEEYGNTLLRHTADTVYHLDVCLAVGSMEDEMMECSNLHYVPGCVSLGSCHEQIPASGQLHRIKGTVLHSHISVSAFLYPVLVGENVVPLQQFLSDVCFLDIVCVLAVELEHLQSGSSGVSGFYFQFEIPACKDILLDTDIYLLCHHVVHGNVQLIAYELSGIYVAGRVAQSLQLSAVLLLLLVRTP